MYQPSIKDADPIARYKFGEHEAVLLANITSAATIQYAYILMVFDVACEECCFAVASEFNFMAKISIGSHYLCVYQEEGHKILDVSNDWADRDKFEEEAIKIVWQCYQAEE